MKKATKVFAAVLAAAIITSAFASCSKQEAKVVASIDDLYGATVAVQLGTTGDNYVSTDEFKEAKTNIQRFKSGFEAVNSLKQSKVDAIVIDNEPAKAFVAKNDDLKILDEPFADEEYAICLAKDKTELRDKVNGALAALKAEGIVDKIIRNYIADETTGETVPYQYTSPEGVSRTNGTLRMATNATFPPYEYIADNTGSDKTKKVIGIDADMALAIADKLGMELAITDTAFDSIIPEVTTGKADIGMAGLTVTPDREQSVLFSDTYCKAKQVIIVKK